MRRWLVIGLSTFGAAAGATVSFVLASLLSWYLAVAGQQNQSDRDAKAALAHVQAIYSEAATVLRQIAADEAVPCSPAHIRKMLQLTESSPVVVNIGYGVGEVVVCNSWGLLTYRLVKSPAAILRPDGIGLAPNWRPPSFGTDRAMLILRSGDYSALVDQRGFYRAWGGTGDSELLSISLADGTPLLASYAGVSGQRAVSDGEIKASASGDGWTVTVSQPRISYASYVRSEWALLLPLLVAFVLLFGLLALLWLRRRFSLAGELRAAIRNREITAHYQPIVELATRRCVGAEALARWRKEDGSQVPPDVFIPLAEQMGLIENVTEQIVAAVVRDLGDWLRNDPHAHVSINMSASEVSSVRALVSLDEAVRNAGISSRQIWLEATESGILELAVARSTFDELRRRGYRMALDDFGTGYAGLSYLQQLQVDVLKVDRCFVEVIGTDAATRDVTEFIISMAHQLKLIVVAEGVETEAQAAYLLSKGVAYAQGWLFSRALPADAFLLFWESKRRKVGAA